MPGLAEAMPACRAGDTLVVVSLDRLARSVPDAAEIVADLAGRGVVLQVGGGCFGPDDPLGPVLAMLAEFQTALVPGRTTEGMRMVRVAGRLKGRPPKLIAVAEAHVAQLFDAGEHTAGEIAELLAVSRSTGLPGGAPSGKGQAEAASMNTARSRPPSSAGRRPCLVLCFAPAMFAPVAGRPGQLAG